MNTMSRYDTACPLCQNVDRVPIRRLDGSHGLYCPVCKFVEEIIQLREREPLPQEPPI